MTMLRRLLPLAVIVLCIAPACAHASGATMSRASDRLASLPLDTPAYARAKGCAHHAQPGLLALRAWLVENSAGTPWGIEQCRRVKGTRNWSLHAEGRAIDWALNVHVPAERAAADRLVRRLLATDRAGNANALALRIGAQEIIWNCTIWLAGFGTRMTPYSACHKGVDDSTAHRNHVHIGLSWPGARMQTSFWTHPALAGFRFDT